MKCIKYYPKRVLGIRVSVYCSWHDFWVLDGQLNFPTEFHNSRPIRFNEDLCLK